MAAPALKTARNAQYWVLELAPPGRPRVNAGVLLLDGASDQLYLRLRRDWELLADSEDAEVLAHLEADLRRRSRETGGGQLLRSLEDTLSNTLRIADAETALADVAGAEGPPHSSACGPITAGASSRRGGKGGGGGCL